MTYDSTILTEAVNAHYYSEVLILVLLVLLCIVAVIASVFCFKELVGNSRKKTLLIVLAACLCSAVLISIRVVAFLPVYKDYKNTSYIVEEDAQFYIIEGTNNPWEAKNEVLVTTSNGEEIKLTITNDHQFETDIALNGTVVYTKHSKHIVWFSTEDYRYGELISKYGRRDLCEGVPLRVNCM